MAITLPLPLRVAAGIVATGIQLVRSLPEEIPALPVTVVGNAMRLSMRVQQEITTLATRGDELLGGLLGGQIEENPAWATFDEDKEPPASSTPAQMARTARAVPRSADVTAATPPGAAGPEAEPRAASKPPPTRRAPLRTPEATALSDTDTTATEAAAEVADVVVEAATHAAPEPTVADGQPESTAASARTSPADASGGRSPDGAVEQSLPAEDDGPAALPGYDRMTLAQVRGHLRDLTADDVSALLAYEQSGDNRAPFLTLLSNRLVTLGAQQS